MRPQRKILLGIVAASLVISIAITIVFATRPEIVETVFQSSSESNSSIPDWANELIDLEDDEQTSIGLEDDYNTDEQTSIGSNGGGTTTTTPSKPATNVKVLNNPKGWSSSADKTKNAANIKWPSLSPNQMNAGWPIIERTGGVEDGLISEFVLMKETNPSLSFSVECNISGNEITALLPAGTQIHALVPEFTINADKILYGNSEIKSGKAAFNFTVPVELTVVKGNKRTKFTVYIMTLNTGLPSMSITTNDNQDILSKTEYKKCNVFAGGGNTANGNYSFGKNQSISGTAQIKGRGWTSWYYYPKKGYTLKFDKKQSMLGLPAHKEWVLSANFADRSLMRNAVAMELSRMLGAEAIMDVRFVDLWVNGIYAGNYQLIEKIEVSKNRIDIADFDSKLAPDKVGYIIEATGHNKPEEFYQWTNGVDVDRPSKWVSIGDHFTYDPISGDIFYSSPVYNGAIYTITKPSDTKLTKLNEKKQLEYLNYIYDYMNKTEAALKSGNYNQAAKYMDMEAMAKWYIVEELAMNTDSKLHASCYMYKDAGGKLKMGPVWDFDLGFGNGKYANEKHINKTYLDETAWFKKLVSMPEFRAVAKKVWNNAKKKIPTLLDFIDDTAKLLNKAQAVNFELWSITDYADHTYAYSTEMITKYAGQVEYLSEFVEGRIAYMNRKIGGW